jgi:hypothetical protein
MFGITGVITMYPAALARALAQPLLKGLVLVIAGGMREAAPVWPQAGSIHMLPAAALPASLVSSEPSRRP